MRAFVSSVLAVTATLVLGGGAQATSFNFSYSFPTSDDAFLPSVMTEASGTFTATDQMNGSFLVTNASGEWNGEIITGVSPVDTEGFNDNLIFPTTNPVLDGDGITFSVGGPIPGDVGLGVVNVFYDTLSTRGYSDESSQTGYSSTFNLTEVSSTPEPSTWALMILGFGAVGFETRRKFMPA